MSLQYIMNPNGGMLLQRVMEGIPSGDNLLEQILSTENVHHAWKRVRSNKGASGIDNIKVTDFPEVYRPKWEGIKKSLMEGTYMPSPVLRVEIPKPDGSKRPLGIPTVLDRLIQQSIAQVLSRIFDPGFSEHSYGFRPGRSGHQAVRAMKRNIRDGYYVAVDMDLSKFFDKVKHDTLMARVSRKIKDKRVLKLIGKYLRAGVVVDGRLQCTREGVPQGGPLSPLLANVMLDDLDKELEKRNHRFARYADDFTILVKSQRSGERVMQSIKRYLERRLKLTVNEKKSQVDRVNRCSFLGFTFIRGKIRWTEKAFAKFKSELKRLTGRSWFVPMDYRMKKLGEYIRGWINYYGISEYYRPIPGLDQWLRRRIRMCYWKQWPRCRTRVRNLIRLGCPLDDAIAVGMSRKGPWHLAKTFATQRAMSNE
ncbi:group II intron reverse transcriptase/maturase [Desulfoluna limicola]|uniref:RNA-directed DNA polymerase n=1 Tax=Desulfoluna limicola TaxID=2810562 RepID=A0ABN6F2J7_9BACT|nr:group II intron reverse transcriptase/maturase [Desulfoluna limicola]BCS96213.1 group II intron reverse transcriptase/maturase [Desulfoluna limicola]